MTVDGRPCDDDNDEGLRHVIRLEKVSDENVTELDAQHVVRVGPFRGVVVRPPLSGNTKTLRGIKKLTNVSLVITSTILDRF